LFFIQVNILKLEAYFERDNAVYLVTERMETDMFKYITNTKNRYLDEDTSKMLIYQVIVALRYLHASDCSHLDIKCENILISFLKPIPSNTNKPKQNGKDSTRDIPLVKLADFGYSRIIGEHSFRKTRVGTVSYIYIEKYSFRIWNFSESL
jgi:serine/threonine protein kinase